MLTAAALTTGQQETVEHFGIGYCSRGIMRGTIAIPIHDEEGQLVASAGRRLKPSDIREYGKYKLPKGFKQERVLYKLPPLAGSDLGHERGHTKQGSLLPCGARPPKPTARILWTTALAPGAAYVTILRPSGGGRTTPTLLRLAR